jgi:hypothetical protein
MRLKFASIRGGQPMLEESTDPQPQHGGYV